MQNSFPLISGSSINGSNKDSLQLKWLKHPKRSIHVHRIHWIPRIRRMPLQATACTKEIEINGGGGLVGLFNSKLQPNELKTVKAYKTPEINW